MHRSDLVIRFAFIKFTIRSSRSIFTTDREENNKLNKLFIQYVAGVSVEKPVVSETLQTRQHTEDKVSF